MTEDRPSRDRDEQRMAALRTALLSFAEASRRAEESRADDRGRAQDEAHASMVAAWVTVSEGNERVQ